MKGCQEKAFCGAHPGHCVPLAAGGSDLLRLGEVPFPASPETIGQVFMLTSKYRRPHNAPNPAELGKRLFGSTLCLGRREQALRVTR